MSYKTEEIEEGILNTSPIKLIPLADAFREDIYNVYKMYRPDVEQTNYYFDN